MKHTAPTSHACVASSGLHASPSWSTVGQAGTSMGGQLPTKQRARSPSQGWPALCQLMGPHVPAACEQPRPFSQNSSKRQGVPAVPGAWQVVPALFVTLQTFG
jgi:hypothetical protein